MANGLISNGTYALATTIVKVEHDTTLTGNGTTLSPLGVSDSVVQSLNVNTIQVSLTEPEAGTPDSVVTFVLED